MEIYIFIINQKLLTLKSIEDTLETIGFRLTQ